MIMLCNRVNQTQKGRLGKEIQQIIQGSLDEIFYLCKGQIARDNFNLATKFSSIWVFKVRSCLLLSRHVVRSLI